MKAKDSERTSGALAAFARLFSRNWGLKLVSLVLAILLSHTLKPVPATPRTTSANTRPPRGGDHVVEVIEQVARPAPPPPAPGAPPAKGEPKKK